MSLIARIFFWGLLLLMLKDANSQSTATTKSEKVAISTTQD
jgi:hypothetical protein